MAQPSIPALQDTRDEIWSLCAEMLAASVLIKKQRPSRMTTKQVEEWFTTISGMLEQFANTNSELVTWLDASLLAKSDPADGIS